MTKLSGILLTTAALVVGQTTPTRQVTGTVLDSITSVPIVEATVKISCWATRQALLVQEVLTDTQGGFLFKNVPAKFQTEYFCKLSATKNGYLPSAEVDDSEEPDPTVLRLTPQSVISGTVFDDHGRPLPSVHLQLFRRIIRDGIFVTEAHKGAYTDERGEFRLPGLAADSYRLCLTPWPNALQQQKLLAFHETCEPPTDAASVPGIRVSDGEMRNLRIDAKPAQGVRVSGHVSNARHGVFLRLYRTRWNGLPVEHGIGRWDPETSTFELSGVLPGKYQLEVQQGSGGNQTQAVRAIEVGSADIGPLELTLRPDPVLRGRFITEDGSPLPQKDIQLSLDQVRWQTQGLFRLPIGRDGSFSTSLSMFDTYRISAQMPEPWHVRAFRRDGVEIPDEILALKPDGNWGNLEIFVSRSVGSITGAVLAGGTNDHVVRVLRERGNGFIQAGVSGFDNQNFEIKNLPPGKYLVFAWPRDSIWPIEVIPYLERNYLETLLPYRTVVNVVEGRASQVKVKPVPPGTQSRR